MYTLKVIWHSDVSKTYLDEIIKIKSAAWPYPYEKQLEWINANIKKTDLHLILIKDDEAVAYLNLIDIDLEVNKKICDAFGIGNVCAIEKGKGYGNELMKHVNQYIIDAEKVGLLFCKKELVAFYEKCGWLHVDKNKLLLTFENSNIETMVFNHLNIIKLQYNGQLF